MINSINVGGRTLFCIKKKLYPSILILLLYFKFFYLIKLPGTYGDRTNEILPVIVCNSVLMITILRNPKNYFKIPHARYFLFLLLFLITEVAYAFAVYSNEPYINAIFAASTYTLLLSYFIFYNAAKKHFEYFIRIIIIFSTVTAVLFIVQAIAYNIFQVKFINILGFSYGSIHIDYRKGVRIIAADLVSYSAVISIGCLFWERLKNKKLYVINIMVIVVYELYVSQTRSMQLVLFTTILAVLVFSGKKKSYLRMMKIFVFSIIIMLTAQEIKGYISAMILSVTRKTDFSMYQRVAEIQHYISVLRSKWPLGIGLLGTHIASSGNEWLVSGGKGYTYSDVGVMGVFAHFGVLGLIIYITPFIDFVKKCKSSGKEINSIALAITVATFMSFLSLSFWDAERIIIFPILWALVTVSFEKMKIKQYSIEKWY